MTETKEALRNRLNLESGRISWHELLPHHQRGALIRVDGALDLVEVAARIAEDDAGTISDWMTRNALQRVGDDQAELWTRTDPTFWAIVVSPWVLIQEETGRC